MNIVTFTQSNVEAYKRWLKTLRNNELVTFIKLYHMEIDRIANPTAPESDALINPKLLVYLRRFQDFVKKDQT